MRRGGQGETGDTYWTPVGCRRVGLIAEATMFLSDVEW